MNARAVGSRCWLLLAALVMFGCARDVPERIRVGIPIAPLTLDPRFATDAMSQRVVRLLHPSLVRFDARREPLPALAHWEMRDPTHYRFTLTASPHCDDGTILGAADVAATYRAVLAATNGSPLRARLAVIESVTTIDDATVEFALKRPDATFPGLLTLGVMPAAAAARDRDDWRVGCGAFALQRQRADGSVELRRRRDGALFELAVVKDANVRALKLAGGQLDIVQGSLPPEVFDWLASRPGLRGTVAPGSTMSYIGVNLRHEALARRDVRAAIAHAIDRETITRRLFRGQAHPAAGLLPPSHWAVAPDLAIPRYDPMRARALLAAAGYADRRLVLHYKTSADSFRLRLATALQAQLAAVGIDLVIESLDWTTFYADISAGRFELYGLSWVGLALPDIYRQAFHSASAPPNGLNRGHYAELEFDALVQAAEASIDRDAARKSLQLASRRLLDDLPFVPLWFEDQTWVSARDIQGYASDVDGNFDALDATTKEPAGGND